MKRTLDIIGRGTVKSHSNFELKIDAKNDKRPYRYVDGE